MDLHHFRTQPLLGILRSIRPPSRGGDTMWVNLYKAYETLSPKMQAIISDLSAWHADTTILAAGTSLTLAAYGFRVSLGRGPLIKDPLAGR